MSAELEHAVSKPNLAPVRLIAGVGEYGHPVDAGDRGENITTRGLDFLSLPTGTALRLGPEAAIEPTGLRNPCVVDSYNTG